MAQEWIRIAIRWQHQKEVDEVRRTLREESRHVAQLRRLRHDTLRPHWQHARVPWAHHTEDGVPSAWWPAIQLGRSAERYRNTWDEARRPL